MLLFAHGGHQASCVESVEAALEFMLGQEIDLLITDVMMPGVDGLELFGMIRRTHTSRFLPVVIFSALADPEFQQYAISKGVSGSAAMIQ